MRLVWIFLGLAILVLTPFLIWGESFDHFFTQKGVIEWLEQWGALGGVALLVSDLFLPVPGTVVMSAMGYFYGWFMGGLYSSAGSFLSGLLAYYLCRGLGHDAAERLIGKNDIKKGERLFLKSGGWLVAMSRWLPMLPEIVSCMAGLMRMPRRIFIPALLCGSLPVGFVFAAIGHAGKDSPALALTLSAVIPLALWFIAKRTIREE